MNMNMLLKLINLFFKKKLFRFFEPKEKGPKNLPLPLMSRYLVAVSDRFGSYSVRVCCLDLLSVLINLAHLK